MNDQNTLTEWREFIPQVVVQVGDIPDDMAASYILDAAIDFCERTSIVRSQQQLHITNRIGIVAPSYDGWEPARWISVRYPNGRPVVTRAYRIINNNMGIHITLNAFTTDSVFVELALIPTPTSLGCPTWLYRRYGRDIIAGACSRLLQIADKTIANPAQAALFNSQFLVGVRRAVSERITRNSALLTRSRGRMLV